MESSVPELFEKALEHHKAGQLPDAESLYRRILAKEPRHADAHHLLGVLALQLNQSEIAVSRIGQALEINAAVPAYHSNLGTALQALDRLEEALASYDAAIRLAPDYADAHSNRGNILRSLGRPDEALAAYEAALRLQPEHGAAHCNRGNALRELNRFDEALAEYDAALSVEPTLAEAHSNRAAILSSLGYFDEPIAAYAAALRLKPSFPAAHSNLILDLHYGSEVPDQAIQAAQQRFAKSHPPPSASHANSPNRARRLRIGYVSGDFCRHSVAYFLVPVLANHDHDAYEVFCYATRLHEDDMTARLRASADHWRSLAGLTDAAAAALIREDQVDILVDLSGHSAHNRLPVFAQKPAPVQVTWLGFPSSTGLAALDYRLVDAITDPEDAGGWSSESLVRLPNGFLCFEPPREAPEIATPPGLKGPITFGSFNNPAKLSLATLDAWAALLKRVPDSRLLLKGRPFGEESARRLLLERLKKRGVAADRVTLLGWAAGTGGHLGLYGQIDIALDPFPYNGTTTTCEALWMGVPVVTLKGARHSARVGASLLTRVGLEELIAEDTDSYVHIAAELATDRKRLSELRSSLRHRLSASSLCDGPAFTRDLEEAFRALWQTWCEQATPSIREALQHHQAGRLPEAERLYRQILAADANHADALHLLGTLAHQVGKNEKAITFIGQAIGINPGNPSYHSNLGLALNALNRLDEALAAYDAAIRLDPNHASAHSNRGNVLKDLGRLEEAVAAYDDALKIEPNHSDAHSNRGGALKRLGRLEEALAAYDAALRVAPLHAGAHSNRGNVLQKLACPEEALAAQDTAICLQPTHARAYYNRGNILRELGQFEGAIAAYDMALRIKPDLAEAHSNRGNVLKDLGRLDEALAAYDAALHIETGLAETWSNRGAILNDLGRAGEALAACDAALRLKPDFAEAHANRASVLAVLGRFDQLAGAYESAIRYKPDLLSAHSGLILDLHYGSEVTGMEIQAATERFGNLHQSGSPSFGNVPDPSRRLRIGYVSGDFRRHSVSYFLAPVLTNHDHQTFEVHCYATHHLEDQVTAKLRASADRWRSLVGLSDLAAAELIRNDAIDILIDLSGHTAHNRLPVFAQKPAPLQVTWLGFPGSTGLAAMDYRLIDEITDPEDSSRASETLYRLPNGFLCYQPPEEAPDVGPLPCLKGPITFGSFNNPAKLSVATLDAWAELLKRVPDSRLLLKGRPFGDETVRASLLERLQSRGIAADRVTLLGREADLGGHLGLYDRIDIALDPFPYNGTTTTCEALWMGVPVVTLKGVRHSGRVGASLLTRVGLDKLIADDTESYIRIAANLAADRKRLSKLRGNLRQRVKTSSLCDGPAFTHDLETALRTLWQGWCEKARPPVAMLFREAIQFHQSGRLADAEHLYRQILAVDDRHADTLHLLGVLAHQMGANEAAVELIGKAVETHPGIALYHFNLGIALAALNRLDEALASCERTLDLQPDHADAHCNRGQILERSGRLEQALQSYDAALRLKPDHFEAHYNRGNTLRKLGREEEALASYDIALCLRPDHVDAHSNRGTLLSESGRKSEALASFDFALNIRPDHIDALSNRGATLVSLERFNEALASCDATLRLAPNHRKAHYNRGNALRQLGRLSDALAAYDAALRIEPDFAEVLLNRAVVLKDLGRLEEAIASFEAALRLKPDLHEAHTNLILALYYGSEIGDETIEAASRRLGDLFPALSPAFANSPHPDRRLRIGYVSGDFRRHSVTYFLASALTRHDHRAFEIFCYATYDREDEITARLRASADHWRSLTNLTGQVAADLVRSDQIDILIDLAGHTAHNGLHVFALRPAPVQVTWLGFPGTTGLAAIDYRLIDAITDPENASGWTSETLFRLPNGFLCFDPPADAPEVVPPPGLNGPITFGSFNNPPKLSHATLDAWAEILKRVPDSRLLLKGQPYGDEAARALLLERMNARGIMADRVTLLAWSPDPGGHLGLYGKIDIALDPFPYNGTTTTCEALWMGVPVVTIEGTRHSGRVGASLLTRLDLRELIGTNTDDYVCIAADLAADRGRLTALRQSLRHRMKNSPLCDGPAFARDLEAAFRTMWWNWCEKTAQA